MQSKSLSTNFVAFAVFGVSYAIASRQGAVSEPDSSGWLCVDQQSSASLFC